MTRLHIRHMFIAAAVALTVPVLGYAQVQRVPGGDILDANPQVGSGGSNTPIPGYTPINGNDVMTGNVTGLGYFHGSVPYTSPYQFQGTLGTSNLQSFERQSAGTPLGGTYTGRAQTYYLPSNIVSTYSGRINPGAALSPVTGGFDARLTGRLAVNPTAEDRNALPATAMAPSVVAVPAEVPMQSITNYSTQSLTPSYETPTASSLFGLRYQEPVLGEPVAPGTAGLTQREYRAQVLGTPAAPNASTPGGQTGNQETAEAQPGVPQSIVAPLDLQQKLGPAAAPPLDQRINPAVGVAAAPGATPGQTGTTANATTPAGPTAYSSLLDQLYANQQRLTEQGRAATANQPGQTNQNNQPVQSVQLAPGQMATQMPGQQPSQAFMPGQTGMGASATGATTLPGMPGAQAAPSPTALLPESIEGRAALQAGRNLKPLETLTGTQGTRFDDVMGTAEAQLRAGQFMTAAETYQSALRLQPNDGLALVGRANAELAAGMYESAAYDFKYLFRKRPEMISVPYDLKRFLPESRITYLRDDLQRLAKEPGNRPAPLLLAYIDYQLGEKAQLESTLGHWQKNQPDNPWPELLTKAWAEPVTPAKAK